MSPDTIIREKRKNPRVKQEVPVELVFQDEVTSLEGKTKDLSCVGAKLILDHSLTPQTQYAVTLELPGGRQHLKGIVVRSEKIDENFEVSLYFNDITMETRRKINDFVKEKWI
jgi:hypothetical protein